MPNIKVEYVWIGGHGELRSKTKICYVESNSELKLENLPSQN